ncbi:hypothetical protein I8751_19605 [Nostocaceae cyanobacterium CENA357]|uniref:Uncharacterized protein n=1 Tax=Atlanticothrix silvestris CENA357 TaxID=1725252 RepID=A0A8J7HF02_9CYAN|nr:hypothetical protein [Atlanticothrix silvestris CENA357]
MNMARLAIAMIQSLRNCSTDSHQAEYLAPQQKPQSIQASYNSLADERNKYL